MVLREVGIIDVEFEGLEFVIYVKNFEVMMKDGELIKNFVKVFKKCISVCLDFDILLFLEKVEELIK